MPLPVQQNIVNICLYKFNPISGTAAYVFGELWNDVWILKWTIRPYMARFHCYITQNVLLERQRVGAASLEYTTLLISTY